MNKEEFIKLLEKLEVPISETTPEDSNMEAPVRIHFWDYIWDSVTASDKEYNTNVTYQVSFLADEPRHPKLLELKKSLNEVGIFPRIQHEYITAERRIHSYFSIEILENIE